MYIGATTDAASYVRPVMTMRASDFGASPLTLCTWLARPAAVRRPAMQAHMPTRRSSGCSISAGSVRPITSQARVR